MSDSFSDVPALLANPEARQALSDCFAIASLLDACVISRRYRIPAAFSDAVRLTDLGDQIQQEVMSASRNGKLHETRFAIFLEGACDEGLLVDPSTDVAGLLSRITDEILAGRILFPYMYGRELHDLASRTYPERFTLDETESVELLSRLPCGIFQEGRILVGPHGAHVSDQYRVIASRLTPPGYYCSDETCSRVHPIQLSTSEDAAINKARAQVTKVITRRHSGTEDRSARVVNESLAAYYDPLPTDASESLFDTLADSVGTVELQAIANILLRGCLPERGMRSKLARIFKQFIADPSEFVQKLDRPSVLELLLLFSDRRVVMAVDEAIRLQYLQLEEYEVRTSRIRRTGSNDGWADIGPRGVRRRQGNMAQRLYSLLNRLYLEADVLDIRDLEYVLEVQPGLDSSELLEAAVRKWEPRELLERLVVFTRIARDEAVEYLGINAASTSREELIDIMLWKLGEPAEVYLADLERLTGFERALTSSLDSQSGEDVLRGHLTNLFKTVEDALQKALIFSTWALTVDHYLSEDAFSYDPAQALSVMQFIDDHAPTDDPHSSIHYNGRNTLASLAAGFGRLRKALANLDAAEFTRPTDQYPSESRLTKRPFSFIHTLPFLDLTARSQEEVLAKLSSISTLLNDETVVGVRNSTVHGNSQFPSRTELRLSLEKVAAARTLLSDSGLFPEVYSRKYSQVDKVGRQELTYTSGPRVEKIFTPSWAVAPKVPNAERMIILGSARLASIGPLRFLVRARTGLEDYWQGWPKRWSGKTATQMTDERVPAGGATYSNEVSN